MDLVGKSLEGDIWETGTERDITFWDRVNNWYLQTAIGKWRIFRETVRKSRVSGKVCLRFCPVSKSKIDHGWVFLLS